MSPGCDGNKSGGPGGGQLGTQLRPVPATVGPLREATTLASLILGDRGEEADTGFEEMVNLGSEAAGRWGNHDRKRHFDNSNWNN